MDLHNAIIEPDRAAETSTGLGERAGEVLHSLMVGGSRAMGRLGRLRAVMLLDGNVRKSGLAHSTGRSILDLPIHGGATLLDLWSDQVRALAKMLNREALTCRLLLGQGARKPARQSENEARISVELDSSDLRGTGGVLRDATAMYDDEDVLLVANAAQLLIEPLPDLARQAQERGGEVTIVSNINGSPVSLMLLTCRALRVLPEIGFVDLKEQGLPQMAARHEVTVLSRPQPGALSIRTARDLLGAVEACHEQSSGQAGRSASFAERWSNGFSVIEPGAQVAPDAIIHDSVILAGARVDAGAVVVDSLVCGGGVVRRRQHVRGQLVTGAGPTALD